MNLLRTNQHITNDAAYIKLCILHCVLYLFVLTSCQNEEIPIDFGNDRMAVKVEAVVGESLFTRSNPTDDTKQTVFNSGDQIAISNEGTFVNYTFDGTSWSPEAGKYLKWEQNTMTFNSYYPVTDGTNMTAFTLPLNQSDIANITSADYMTVSTALTKNGTNPISLAFERKTARVIVKITGFGEQYTETEKKVCDVKIVSGAESLSGTTATAVTPFANGVGGLNTTYTALVIPAAINGTADFITLTDGKNNSLVVKGIPAHVAGMSYTYDLKVGKDAVSITGVTVADWETGEIINEGTEIVPLIGDYYYSDDTYSTKLDDTKIVSGVIYWTDKTNPKHFKIVSLQEPPKNWNELGNNAGRLRWSTEKVVIGTTSADNGLACMRKIMEIADWQSKYPAFAYAHSLNGDNPDYTDGSSVWYLPARKELKALYAGYCGLRWVSSGANENEGEINDWDDSNTMPGQIGRAHV